MEMKDFGIKTDSRGSHECRGCWCSEFTVDRRFEEWVLGSDLWDYRAIMVWQDRGFALQKPPVLPFPP